MRLDTTFHRSYIFGMDTCVGDGQCAALVVAHRVYPHADCRVERDHRRQVHPLEIPHQQTQHEAIHPAEAETGNKRPKEYESNRKIC